MTKAIDHIVVTAAPDSGLAEFVEEVVGMEPAYRLRPSSEDLARGMGWPDGNPGTRAVVLGRTYGALEIIDIPPEVAEWVPAGVAVISFRSRDLEEIERACRVRELETTGIYRPNLKTEDGAAHEIEVLMVKVAGLLLEFVRFGHGDQPISAGATR